MKCLQMQCVYILERKQGRLPTSVGAPTLNCGFAGEPGRGAKLFRGLHQPHCNFPPSVWLGGVCGLLMPRPFSKIRVVVCSEIWHFAAGTCPPLSVEVLFKCSREMCKEVLQKWTKRKHFFVSHHHFFSCVCRRLSWRNCKSREGNKIFC